MAPDTNGQERRATAELQVERVRDLPEQRRGGIAASLRELGLRGAGVILAPVMWAMHVSGACSLLFALRGFERVRWHAGKLGVWLRFQSAVQRVPAYSEFLGQEGIRRPALLTSIAAIPAMDKENYVKRSRFSRGARVALFPGAA